LDIREQIWENANSYNSYFLMGAYIWSSACIRYARALFRICPASILPSGRDHPSLVIPSLAL